MASSTSMPIATASPPRVIVFMDDPVSLKYIIEIASDSGIAVIVMKVVRTLNRNINKITNTIIEPSIIASFTLSTAVFMNWS